MRLTDHQLHEINARRRAKGLAPVTRSHVDHAAKTVQNSDSGLDLTTLLLAYEIGSTGAAGSEGAASSGAPDFSGAGGESGGAGASASFDSGGGGGGSDSGGGSGGGE